MEIKVTKNNVTIQEIDPVHSGEFNVNQCNFTFSETYTNDLVKKAIFTKLKNKTSYEVTINNDTCIIPYEVLQEQGEVQLGVYAYEVDGEDLILRYSPKATRFMVGIGSYLNADDGTIKVPALTLEEYEQALNDLLADVEASKEEIVQEVVDEATPAIIEYAQEIIDQIPTGTVEGEVINIQDSSNLPIKDFQLKGNAVQDGTPTPDNPVDIKVVTGDVEVNVVGKNLASISSGNNIVIANNLLAGTYTFSIDINFACGLSLKANNSSGETIISNSYSASGRKSLTFTIQETTSIFLNGFSSTTGKSFAECANNYQIEVGSTATNYEPYTETTVTLPLGNIELAKIGNYTDRIFKSEGKWYKEKYIDKVTVNGSESWALRGDIPNLTNTACFRMTTAAVFENGLVNSIPMTNRFIGLANNNDTEHVRELSSSPSYRFMVFIDKTRLTTVDTDTFKTWLGNNNIEVYFVLATPTTTEITDTTLINALEELLATSTYKNVTNIYTYTDNATPTLQIVYRKDLETLFNNLAGTTSVASINSVRNIDTLENTPNLKLDLDPQNTLDVIDENLGEDNVEE